MKYNYKLDWKFFIFVEVDVVKILYFNGKFKFWKCVRLVGVLLDVVLWCGFKGVECVKFWWEYFNFFVDEILRYDDIL